MRRSSLKKGSAEIDQAEKSSEAINLFPLPLQGTNTMTHGGAARSLFPLDEENGGLSTPADQTYRFSAIASKSNSQLFHTPTTSTDVFSTVPPTPQKPVAPLKRKVRQRKAADGLRMAPICQLFHSFSPNVSQRVSSMGRKRKIGLLETSLKFNDGGESTTSLVCRHCEPNGDGSLPFSPIQGCNFSSPIGPGCSYGRGLGVPNIGVVPRKPLSQQQELVYSFGELCLPSESVESPLSQAEWTSLNRSQQFSFMSQAPIKELGSGSFGKVALYRDPCTGLLVAVKSCSAAVFGCRQRFLNERRILSIVSHHHHTVRLMDSWDDGLHLCLKLEYCPGGSVAAIAEQKRARKESWEEVELLVFLTHMCMALDELHQANIAHVDVKPDNVLIDAKGGYSLTDFGFAVQLSENGKPLSSEDSCSGGAEPCGSPAERYSTIHEGDCRYLCFDMLNQKRYIKEGDMFSLGMSMFELMSGEPLPQRGEEFLKLRTNAEAVSRLSSLHRYSKDLISLVGALLMDSPLQRLSARQVLQALQPPPQLPQVVSDQLSVLKWTSDGNTVRELVRDGTIARSNLRYLAACVESLSWLLGSAIVEYEKLDLPGSGNDKDK